MFMERYISDAIIPNINTLRLTQRIGTSDSGGNYPYSYAGNYRGSTYFDQQDA